MTYKNNFDIIDFISDKVTLADKVEEEFHKKGVYYNEFKRLKINPEENSIENVDYLRSVLNNRVDQALLSVDEIEGIILDCNSLVNMVAPFVLNAFNYQDDNTVKDAISSITHNNFYNFLQLMKASNSEFVINFLLFFKSNFHNFIIFNEYLEMTLAFDFDEKYKILTNSSYEYDENAIDLIKPFFVEFKDKTVLALVNFYLEFGGQISELPKFYKFFKTFDNTPFNFSKFAIYMQKVHISKWCFVFEAFMCTDKSFVGVDFLSCIFNYFSFDRNLLYFESFKTLLIAKGPFYPNVLIETYRSKENIDFNKLFIDYAKANYALAILKLIYTALKK